MEDLKFNLEANVKIFYGEHNGTDAVIKWFAGYSVSGQVWCVYIPSLDKYDTFCHEYLKKQ